MATDMTVSRTILAQLGGRRFTAMTGAKNMVGGADYLAFSLPRGLVKGINKVKITLTPADTYTMEFGSIHRLDYKVKKTVSDVYCDTLVDHFESATGLAASL